MNGGVWKTIAVALLAIIGTVAGSSMYTGSKIEGLRVEVSGLRERMARVEANQETLLKRK